MQAYAEHQQHDADLGQLASESAIGDKAGGEGADRNPRDQITDQRRRAQARGEEAAEKRQGEPDGEGGEEHHIVWHARVSLSEVIASIRLPHEAVQPPWRKCLLPIVTPGTIPDSSEQRIGL
jgi:hypothetical protein